MKNLLRLPLLGLSLAALLTLSLPTTVQATDNGSPKINYTRFSDKQLSEALEAEFAARRPDWCGTLVPLTRQMATRGTFSSQMDGMAIEANQMCAVVEERWSEAYRWMIALERKTGERSAFAKGVTLSYLAERYDAADERLFDYIDADDKLSLNDSDFDVIWQLARTYTKTNQRDRTLALFRALAVPNRMAKYSTAHRGAVGSRLFQIEVEVGEVEAASANINFLKSPRVVQKALADRRFAKLWPQVEAIAGENMIQVTGANVDQAKADFDANPDDLALMRDLADAYLNAGRFDDVVTLVGKYEPAPDAYDSLTEDMGWALNTKVYALDALDRGAEAEAIFDGIAALALDDRTRGWLVNFVINRAIRFVDLGQADKALTATALAKTIAAESGSNFARMLVRQTTICALRMEGRTAELPPLVAEVIAHAADDPTVAAQALVCADAHDEAAKIVRGALNDPMWSGGMIEELQSPDFNLSYRESVIPSLFERLRKRPDIAPLFDKLARDIPRAFVPSFTARRAELRAKKAAQ